MSLREFFLGKRTDTEYYDADDEIIEAEVVGPSRDEYPRESRSALPIRKRLKRLRKAIDPDGTPKPTMAEEADYLAEFLGLTYSVGATLPEKVEFLEKAVLGFKGDDKTVASRSIGSDIDKMVRDLGITIAPGDGTITKLESIEKHLGIDSDTAAEKPLVARVKTPYEMLYGASR